jgi:hypothetical protein
MGRPGGGMRIRAWLQLFRLHTASAELGGLGIAAFLAGVRGWMLLPVLLFAILWHATGFGENSLLDWIYGYDRNDPSKAHHPLNTGAIRRSMATDTIVGMHILGIVFFIGMIYLYHTVADNIPISLLLFALAILFGNAYNFIGKRNKWAAAVEISLTFSLLTGSIFFLAGGTFGAVPLLLLLYAFFYVYFQIAFAGEWKELGQQNERNILRQLRCYVDSDGNYHMSGAGKVFGAIFTVIKAVLLLLIAAYVYRQIAAVAAIGVPAVIVLSLYLAMLLRARERGKGLTVMGAGEALSYIILVPAIISVAQWPYVLLFILLPMIWFVALNRLTWNTFLAPQV